MKKKLLMFLLAVANGAAAQQAAVRGVVVDRADGRPLANASIVLLDTDSIMRRFARADEDGKFAMKNVKQGDYLLQVTYPKFEVYSRMLSVREGGLPIDSIPISSRANLIEEVIITQKIPIRLRGDTIEYDADSFETEKNAKLEDLLRRLPGMTVSASGTIRAMGKTVSKVLIDGEEFFGYDPKIAIRNVRADAVDKVQVYERKSEEAELTGVDDGVRMQTVNVVLKEEARKGIFGNAAASAGTHDLFAASLFAAKFDQTERIGLTGSWNNMGNSDDAGRIRSNSEIIGRPRHKDLGANYEANLLGRKVRLNSYYSYNNNGNENASENYSKQILGADSTQETTRRSASVSDGENHMVQARARYRIDSLSNLNLQLGGRKGRAETSSSSFSQTLRNEAARTNDFRSDNRTDGEDENLDLRLDYRRRMNKKGRSMNIHLNTDLNNNGSTNRVDERTNYYNLADGSPDSAKRVEQLRLNADKNSHLSASANISEPISERLNLTAGYSFRTSDRSVRTDAYNGSNGGRFDLRDTLYSKDQVDLSRNNGFDLNLQYRTEKLDVNLSNRTNHRQQRLTDSYRAIDLERTFWQSSTSANVRYSISNRKSASLSYNNSTTVPSFGQLQPLQPPTNELYRQLGNPDLKREARSEMSFSYNTFSMLRASSFSVSGVFDRTSNAIVNRSVIDGRGRTTASFVNISDRANWNASLHGNYDRPAFNGIVRFGPEATLAYGNNHGYVNGELNRHNSANASLGISANKQNSRLIDFDMHLSTGVENERNSIRPELDDTNFQGSLWADIKYHLPHKFSLTQVVHYSYTGRTKVFPEPIEQFFMNFQLTRKLLKSESLLLSVRGFDVFGTYNNTNRSAGNSSFSQNQQQMLTRHFMLGLQWDFNKNMGKKSE